MFVVSDVECVKLRESYVIKDRMSDGPLSSLPNPLDQSVNLVLMVCLGVFSMLTNHFSKVCFRSVPWMVMLV